MDSRARKLADLVEQHYALLYRYAYRLSGSATDAEDLTQQTFLIAHRKFDQLRDERSARSWLFTILRNAYLRQLRSPACVPLDGLDAYPADDEPAGMIDVDGEQLRQALLELPEDFRSPLILFYFDDFTYREIADHMGVPMGTVMSRLARAKAWLRRRLSASQLAVSTSPAGARQP